jgi:hypothetical protein
MPNTPARTVIVPTKIVKAISSVPNVVAVTPPKRDLMLQRRVY